MLLPTDYLSPALLRCSHFNGYSTDLTAPYSVRTVYDYEVEYYLRCDGGIRVDGKFLPFQAGEMNLRKPGQMVQGVPPYECYILCVDLVGNGRRGGSGYSFGTPDEAQERYENPLLKSLPDCLKIPHQELVSGLFESILENQGAAGDLASFQLKSSLFFLFSEIFEAAAEQSLSGSTAAVRRAVRRLREEFAGPVKIEKLARESGLSRTFFHRRFLEETGLTPGQFLTRLRMEKAKDLLGFTAIPVGEAGALCGYPDPVYFARMFRRYTGMTPTAYRARAGGRRIE